MCAHQLIGMLGPGQIANLGPRVNALQWLAGQRVPESHTTVSSAATGGQKTVLVRRPGYSLYGSLVVSVCLNRATAREVPHKQLVVIASRCKVLVVW